jgi:hypothetical protein
MLIQVLSRLCITQRQGKVFCCTIQQQVMTIHCTYSMYNKVANRKCSLPLRRVHEIKHTYLVFHTHGLFITWKPSSGWSDPVHPGPRLLVNWAPNSSGKWGGGMCSGWRGPIPAPLGLHRVHLPCTIFLLHNTLSPTVHFNGLNGTAYTRPSMVQNRKVCVHKELFAV